ncbi:hypothetical protein J6590_088519 [Homalodisca vitripennis]|nr:hypothetical protein J6590_088519 [Homalodisca vitripennis]
MKKKVFRKLWDSSSESDDEEQIVFADDSADDDYEEGDAECLYCTGLFSEDRNGEDWIRCKACSRWSHFNCADVGNAVFVWHTRGTFSNGGPKTDDSSLEERGPAALVSPAAGHLRRSSAGTGESLRGSETEGKPAAENWSTFSAAGFPSATEPRNDSPVSAELLKSPAAGLTNAARPLSSGELSSVLGPPFENVPRVCPELTETMESDSDDPEHETEVTGLTHSEVFLLAETLMSWLEKQNESSPTQMLLLKLINPLATDDVYCPSSCIQRVKTDDGQCPS